MLELDAGIMQGWLVVSVVGRLDSATTPALDARRVAWIEEGHRRFIFDLSRLDYISSAGLRSIISTAKNVGPDGGIVSLAGAQGLVKEVVSLSGFDVLLPTFTSVEDALNASA